MRAIDMHSHYSTKKGYCEKNPEALARVKKVFRCEINYRTEQEMAEDLRRAEVKAIFDFGPFLYDLPIDEIKEYNDYAGQLVRDFPDVIIGFWAAGEPRYGRKGLRELERCLRDLGAVGMQASGMTRHLPVSDKEWWPFYELCLEAKAPVLIMQGWGAAGAQHPGGKGFHIFDEHPMHTDKVAAKFPELTIIAARPAWPWQNELIAVLLHKSNVWYELHGWLPKYYPPELKWDIARRLQDKIMWGADYPLIPYARHFKSWEEEGYKKEILDKILFKNAQRLFAYLGRKV